jgi:coenzyme F420-dependent glucose-6-phosphate dehydrogenase
MAIRIGYKASAEQFGPRELIDYSVEAEKVGLDIVAVSDHFQPWRHKGGHAPNALVWLGALAEATERVMIGTSVLTPTLRYEPAIIAQAFGTLAELAPGRVFLGVGTGESLNETPATGGEFPGGKERRRRLAEAVRLIQQLWTAERVDFDGEYYRTVRATVYDKPEDPVPIYIAASGPLAAKLAGRRGDGFISTSGKDPELYATLMENLAEGAEKAGRDPSRIKKMIEIKVSYDRDHDHAMESCKWWAALGLSHEQKQGIDDPIEMERVADENADKAHGRFIVTSNPDEVIEKVLPYVEMGFEELVLHAPGNDQKRFLDQFGADVLPALREETEKAAKGAATAR